MIFEKETAMRVCPLYFGALPLKLCPLEVISYDHVEAEVESVDYLDVVFFLHSASMSQRKYKYTFKAWYVFYVVRPRSFVCLLIFDETPHRASAKSLNRGPVTFSPRLCNFQDIHDFLVKPLGNIYYDTRILGSNTTTIYYYHDGLYY